MNIIPFPHPPTDDCPDPECTACGKRDCPHDEPLHYHHDGCPACDAPERVPQGVLAGAPDEINPMILDGNEVGPRRHTRRMPGAE